MSADAAGETIATDVEVLLDLAALLRRPGNRRVLSVDARPTGLGTSTAQVTAMSGELTAEGMGEQVSITGCLDVRWTGACRRCLEPAEGTMPVELQEIYEVGAVEGETYELPLDEQLDIGPMLAEQALLALPLAPLCGDRCEGPAPEQYPAEVADGEEPAERPPDPRWAVLDQLSFDQADADEG